MRHDHNYLFMTYDFGDSLRAHEKKMMQQIDSVDGNRLLNTSVEDWINYFEEEYKINAPKLLEDQITIDQGEAQIDVSKDPNRLIFDRDQAFYITGTRVTFFVPYEGDKNLFQCRPSTYSLNPPRGEISDSELILSYSRTDHDAAAVKSEFDGTLSQIKQYLERISSGATEFNSTIRDKIRQRIEQRRDKLLKDQSMTSTLGFPLRKRESAMETYTVPITPKKINPQPQPASSAPFKPEPTLEMQQYEDILSIISNMALVLERSPNAFKTMGEEDLRQHFLVQLNGQYQGQATGETFNAEGKTDILIRVDNKNIFIAECKFWEGPEYLTKALDQLLGYASWRDTKTALIIFNRNKNLSSVLEKIPPTIKEQPNYKRDIEFKSETGFRYVLNHKDDPNRELILTVLVFDVPGN